LDPESEYEGLQEADFSVQIDCFLRPKKNPPTNCLESNLKTKHFYISDTTFKDMRAKLNKTSFDLYVLL